MLEKCFKPKQQQAWWFISGSAFHQATESYDRLVWEHGVPDSPDKSTGHLLDLLVSEFDAEIAKAEQEEPDRSLWLRGGRVSKQVPDKEAEAFYRAQFPDWAAAYDHHTRTSGDVIYTLDDGAPAIEFGFNVTFGGVMVRGYIDRLIISQGMLGVRDLKSGSSAGEPIQLDIYKCALERLGAQDIPTWGDFWNPRKGTSQQPAVALTRTPEFFDRQYAAFDAQRRSGQIVANVSKDCVRCSVRNVCPAVSSGPDVINL